MAEAAAIVHRRRARDGAEGEHFGSASSSLDENDEDSTIDFSKIGRSRSYGGPASQTESRRTSSSGNTPEEAQFGGSDPPSSDAQDHPGRVGNRRRRVPHSAGSIPAVNVDDVRMFRWNSRTRAGSVDTGSARHAAPQRLPTPPTHWEEDEGEEDQDLDVAELPAASAPLQPSSGRRISSPASSLSAGSRRLSRRHVSFARGVKDDSEGEEEGAQKGPGLSRRADSFHSARGPLLPPSRSVAAAAAGGAAVGAAAGDLAGGPSFRGSAEEGLTENGIPNGNGAPEFPDGKPPEDGHPDDPHAPLGAQESDRSDPWGDPESQYNREELEGLDDEVIQELFMRARDAKDQLENYKNAGSFLLFVALYFAILYLQASSGTGYIVATSHQQLIPNGFSGSQPNRFNGPSDFYTWINDSIIQNLWQDPYCGDSICSGPLEFPAFGSFGCELDCGTFDNVSSMTIIFSQNFPSEQARLDSSWNLCLTYPASICWFPTPQPFPAVRGSFIQDLMVIDGDWEVVINAPKGGVSGSVVAPAPSQTVGGIGADQLMTKWGQCVPYNESNIAQCRTGCANITQCMASVCGPVTTQQDLSGLFVDCVHQCDTDPRPVLLMGNQTCLAVSPNITRYFGFSCRLAAAEDANLLASAAAAAPPVDPPPGIALGADARAAMWESLGPTDAARFFAIKVGVNRFLHTAIKDSCLVDQAMLPTSANLASLSAFLCTLLGGPAALDGCAYKGAATVEDLWYLMRTAHLGAGMQVSRQHQERFVELLVAALASTVGMSEGEYHAVSDALHIFDSAVINASLPGCQYGSGPVVLWGSGELQNLTVFEGSRITWVWGDDKPHSIKATGNTSASMFQGFGSNRLIVSRLTECTPELVGPTDDVDTPTPCVLRSRWEAPGVFSYTQVLPRAGFYTFEGGRLGKANSGEINVLPITSDVAVAASAPANAQTQCSPGCAYWMLSNGQCNAACNVPDCSFDGGDCACAEPGVDFSFCSCPSGQSRNELGECCESSAVGTGLTYSFQMRFFSDDVMASNSVLASIGSALERYVGRNRLLVGMILTQERVDSRNCSGSMFNNLAQCTGGSNTRSWGVNPHYLSSSPLYNPSAREEVTKYSNDTFAFATEYNSDGVPYGFIYAEVFKQSARARYPLVFDINLSNQGATNRLQYLVDGLYLDNSTSNVNVYLITYNGDADLFTVTTVTVFVDEGGTYAARYSIQTLNVQAYVPTPANVARIVLEAIYLAALLWNIVEELVELFRRKLEKGSFRFYFKDVWNWIDIASILVQLAAIGLWVFLSVESQSLYGIQPRYDIYFTLLEFPRYWVLPSPPTGFLDASSALLELEYVINLRYIYFSLQGINVFLVTLRLLKLLDFQPYLGIITRSIAIAWPSLVHFFLVWLCVFTSFSLFAFLVFGSTFEEFSTLWRSFLTCFLLMMNDNGVTYNFIYLQGWLYVAAMLWWFSFTCVIIFVLLNFLIAIIVDAFMEIKENQRDPTTIVQDVGGLMHRARGRWFGPYWRYDRLMKHLYSLGADDFKAAQASSMRKASLGRALRRFNLATIFRRPEFLQPIEPTKMVMKVKGGQMIDPISLNNVLHRLHHRNVEGSSSKRSHRWQAFMSAPLVPGSQRREAPEEKNLDKLSDTLMTMFGEEVEARRVNPLQPVPHQGSARKQEMAEIKGRLEALQMDTAESFAELRAMIQELNNRMRGSPVGGKLMAQGDPGLEELDAGDGASTAAGGSSRTLLSARDDSFKGSARDASSMGSEGTH